MPTPDFETLLYRTAGPVATITLNRPEQLNTIVPPMPDEIEAAVGLAERDHDVKVIVLRGAGRAFSSGADLSSVGIQPEGTYYGKAAPQAQSAAAATDGTPSRSTTASSASA